MARVNKNHNKSHNDLLLKAEYRGDIVSAVLTLAQSVCAE